MKNRRIAMINLWKKTALLFVLMLAIDLFCVFKPNNEVLAVSTEENIIELESTYEEVADVLIEEISTNTVYVKPEVLYSESESMEIETISETNVYKYDISDEDRLFFEQIIAAESYYFWSEEDCLALASVVINRVEESNYGFRNVNTIREVLEQKNQFETYSNKRYLEVPISDSVKEAVDLALKGELNMTSDILFFCTEEFYNTTDSDDFWQERLDIRHQVRNVLFFSVKEGW